MIGIGYGFDCFYDFKWIGVDWVVGIVDFGGDC